MHETRRDSTGRWSAELPWARLRRAGLAMVLLFGLLWLAGPAAAAPLDTACSLSTTAAAPGDSLTARIDKAPVATQVTLTFDGAGVRDSVTEADGTASVQWTVPRGAAVGDHAVTFVGENVYCDASSGFRVTADAARGQGAATPLLQGTVGAAAGRAPVRAADGPGTGGGPTPLTVAVAGTAGAAVVLAGAQIARAALRRRRLQP